MKAPPEPTSSHEPARHIGEHLHADLIPLKTKSLGGNLGIFVAVDEKSSYLVGVPIKSKSALHIQEAAEAMLVEFNRYGHKVAKFTTYFGHSSRSPRQIRDSGHSYTRWAPRKAYRAAHSDSKGSLPCHARWLILPTAGSPRV